MFRAACAECGKSKRVPFDVAGRQFHCGCGTSVDPVACFHRGEPTGKMVACKPCEAEGLSEVLVYSCRLYGEALLRRPVGRGVWDGAVCLTCVDRQAE